MDKLQSQSTSNTASISQAAALAGLNGPQDFIGEMVAVYRERRDLVVDMLNQAPGITCHKPEGAFYVFPSMRGCLGKTTAKGAKITDDESFVIALLDEEGVAACTARRSCIPAISASATPPTPKACARPVPASSGSARGCLRPCRGLASAALDRVRVAATVAMTIKARALREAGADVVTLTIGEPDFATPPHAIEAAHEAALRGDTKYPPQDGTRALKQAVQRKFKRDHGLDFALDEIVVGNGGKQVIFNALMATVDEGDEVIIPAPYWSAYTLMTQAGRRQPVLVSCPQNNGFRLRAGGSRRGDHAAHQMADAELPEQPDRRGACSRGELARAGGGAAEPSACLDHVRRHVRAPLSIGDFATPRWRRWSRG